LVVGRTAAGGSVAVGAWSRPRPLLPGLGLGVVGNSFGVRLPREVLGRMHLSDGDRLVLTEAPQGGYRISPFDPELQRQMELVEEGIRRYRNTLKELAK